MDFPFELLSDIDEAVCELFGVMKMKNMYGKQVRGIERSTFRARFKRNFAKGMARSQGTWSCPGSVGVCENPTQRKTSALENLFVSTSLCFNGYSFTHRHQTVCTG